jgi:hypothetical protein
VPALTYFTARLHYLAVVADVTAGVLEPIADDDPQLNGITASVIITAFIRHTDPISNDTAATTRLPAATLTTPGSALLALAPIRARIDNGQLMLRAEPDRPVTTYTNQAAFPATGDPNRLYRDGVTQLVYQWTGGAYAQTDDFAVVRLVAQTDVLGMDPDDILCYRFAFDNITYGGGEQILAPFAVAAPTTDTDFDLATAARIPL